MRTTGTSTAAPVWQDSPGDGQPTTTAKTPPTTSPRSRSGSPIDGLKEKGDRTGGAGVLTSRQAALSGAVRAGFRVRPQAIEKANNDALEAAIAESLKTPPMRTDAMTNHQSRLLGAMRAGLRVSPQAIQIANNDALAAAIQESLKQSPVTSRLHEFPPMRAGRSVNTGSPSVASPTEPARSLYGAWYNQQSSSVPPRSQRSGGSANAGQPQAMSPPPQSFYGAWHNQHSHAAPLRQQTSGESTDASSSSVPFRASVSGAEVPKQSAHNLLGVPQGAGWSQIFGFARPPIDRQALSDALARATTSGDRSQFDHLRRRVNDVQDTGKSAKAGLEQRFSDHPALPDIKTVLNDAWRDFIGECETESQLIDDAKLKAFPPQVRQRDEKDVRALTWMNLSPNASPHEILGLESGATSQKIRRNYRKLALQYHPDRHPQELDRATAALALINEAHQTLTGN